MSKILVVGDVHGDFSFAARTNNIAADLGIQTVIQVGDFGVWDHHPTGNGFLNDLDEHSSLRGTTWIFLPGNHENYDRLEYYEREADGLKTFSGFIPVRENILYTGKVHKWEWEGKVFKAVGGAYSIDKQWRKPRVSWWVQEQLTDEELGRSVLMGPADYLFTHDCPTNAPFRHRIKDDIDSHAHRQKMDVVGKTTKATQWFHGHMHDYYDYVFEDTKVVGLECNDEAMNSWNGRPAGSGFLNRAVLDIETGHVTMVPS